MQSLHIKTPHNRQVISSIRIFGICSILWGHCSLGLEALIPENSYEIIFQSFTIQLGKMGTILFFIIAGMLVQPKINSYTVFGFLRHRLFTTLLPWMIFVALFVTLILLNDVPSKVIMNNGTLWEQVYQVYHIFKHVVLYYSYWFLLVFMISMIILILFKKRVFNLKIGIVLGLFTLFYGINLHNGWISVHHTKAFLGYVFFVWLGIQISSHYLWFMSWLDKIGWVVLLPLLGLAIAGACWEGVGLTRIGSADPYASIRLSNIVASLVLFICLFKVGKFKAINSLVPDKVVYGVYLLHTVLIYQQAMLIKAFSTVLPLPHGLWSLAVAQALNFVFILFTSIILVKIFYKRKAIAFQTVIGLVTIAKYTRSAFILTTIRIHRKVKFDLMLQVYFIIKIYG